MIDPWIGEAAPARPTAALVAHPEVVGNARMQREIDERVNGYRQLTRL
jgi:hypothetical protein